MKSERADFKVKRAIDEHMYQKSIKPNQRTDKWFQCVELTSVISFNDKERRREAMREIGIKWTPPVKLITIDVIKLIARISIPSKCYPNWLASQAYTHSSSMEVTQLQWKTDLGRNNNLLIAIGSLHKTMERLQSVLAYNQSHEPNTPHQPYNIFKPWNSCSLFAP